MMCRTGFSFRLLGLAGMLALAIPQVAHAEVTMEQLADRMAQMEQEIRELRRTVHEQRAAIDAQGDMLEERELMGVESGGEFTASRYPHTTVGGVRGCRIPQF